MSTKDIVVTTPKNQVAKAVYEAKSCIDSGGGKYYRHFPSRPKHIAIGSKVFYVEDGFVRGFAMVVEIFCGKAFADPNTGMIVSIEESPLKQDGYTVVTDAASWKWIKPIPMQGFQNYRYFDSSQVSVIGTWRDPKPKV